MALVYPLARSSPLLIALWAWWLFDAELSVNAWLGIMTSVAGLWLLAATAKQGGTRHALPWALVAALATSVYSLSDKIAVDYLPHYAALLGYVSLGYLASFIMLSVVNWKHQGQIVPVSRPGFSYRVPGGIFIGNAYALVIYAMAFFPAAYVVALSNAGVVIATLLSMILLKERQSWRRRLAASMVILVGLLILTLARNAN